MTSDGIDSSDSSVGINSSDSSDSSDSRDSSDSNDRKKSPVYQTGFVTVEYRVQNYQLNLSSIVVAK